MRQRVNKIFNKRSEDFETLEEYNNYLEEIENVVFNITNGIDVEKTEAKLHAYDQANRSQILANALRQREEDAYQEQLEALELERKRRSAMLSAQLAQEEREFREQAQRELVKQLATSQGNPDVIARKVESMVQKRFAARRAQIEAELRMPPPQAKGLVRPGSQKPQGPMTPFTPFNGDRQRNYVFEVHDEYADPFLDDIKDKKDYLAGGFTVKAAYKQALVQAFFGLGCNVQQEKAAQGSAPTEVAT